MDEFRVVEWEKFVGQEKTKTRLQVHISGAQCRAEPLEHVLLTGPAGYGKTTLAFLAAQELGNPVVVIQMPIDESKLASFIRGYSGVIFMDEIHRAPKSQQEYMLPLLEFNYVQRKNGFKVYADELTVIGATTEQDKLIPPLYDRFGIKPIFEEYSDDEMSLIIIGMASMSGLPVSDEDALILAQATGGTPRVARQFVIARRDLYQHNSRQIPTPLEILSLCQMDIDGISDAHYRYMMVLEKNGGRAGMKTLQSALSANEAMIRDLERMLVRKDLIFYTEVGRTLTGAGEIKLRRKK